jgi:hypothetical protein
VTGQLVDSVARASSTFDPTEAQLRHVDAHGTTRALSGVRTSTGENHAHLPTDHHPHRHPFPPRDEQRPSGYLQASRDLRQRAGLEGGREVQEGDRVIGARGNLWECKGGDLTKLCDDKGREPDIDAAASEAWELIQSCFVIEVPEVSTTDVSVSSTQCPSAITLTAVIANDSPFGGLSVPVAFYHSASKTLIGVAQVELAAGEGGPGFSEVSMIWNNPLPDSALITVVADDDGTGHGILLETNETDNALATTLVTCPSL